MMDENITQGMTKEQSAKGKKLASLAMFAGGSILIVIGTMFLMGIVFKEDQTIGGVLTIAGFAELVMAWVFLNKSLNTK